jgi:ribosome-binding factor A
VVSTSRATRIAERIREELSEILITHVQDPRLAGISITDIHVDRELAFAEVYYSCLEGSERAKEILEGLKHAQGFLRSELARRIELRVFPRLRFHFDPTYERAERIEKLIASLHTEEEKQTASEESTPDE